MTANTWKQFVCDYVTFCFNCATGQYTKPILYFWRARYCVGHEPSKPDWMEEPIYNRLIWDLFYEDHCYPNTAKVIKAMLLCDNYEEFCEWLNRYKEK